MPPYRRTGVRHRKWPSGINGRPAFVMMDMASFEAREARLSAREAALAMTSAKATQAAAANGTLLAMGVVAAG